MREQGQAGPGTAGQACVWRATQRAAPTLWGHKAPLSVHQHLGPLSSHGRANWASLHFWQRLPKEAASDLVGFSAVTKGGGSSESGSV